MWEKLSHNRAYCAALAGLALVLAFAPINLFPLVLLCPILLNLVTLRAPSFGSGFRFGFLCSLVIMLGAFYWVVYVIHVFGYLPWSVSALLFIGFCGFGALNFPIFVGLASWLHQKYPPLERSPRLLALWFALGLPALYTLVEFLIPKLFPWYMGHFYYRVPLLTQIVELTGCSYLSFITYSLGSVICLCWLARTEGVAFWRPVWAIPLVLWTIDIGFSAYRLLTPAPPSRPFNVGLIQASIGSLEKVAARHGLFAQVRYVLDRYEALSEQSLNSDPKPDLLVWPETAVPFQLDSPGHFAQEVRDAALRWNTPLITGAYAPVPFNPRRDYNAAYLLEPQPPSHTLRMEMRPKNILLAFGEYMPLGDLFPSLYKEFPEVSDFERGTTQEPIELRDGTRLGITICYEAIVPEFFRKVAAKHVQAVINLTNDSWFGPTSEPYQHGALTTFRAIEYRVPLLRVTNTGISFTVDRYGRMSRHSGVYAEDVMNQTVQLPLTPPETLYLKLGEWFNIVGAIVLAGLIASLRRKKEKDVPVPV